MREFHAIGERAVIVDRINVAETARTGPRPEEIGNGPHCRFPERETIARPIFVFVRNV